MESDDLENLEEELYSKIYHDSNSPNTIEANADLIIENSALRKTTGSSRYYQENVNNKNSNKAKQSQNPRFIKPRKFQNSAVAKNQTNAKENKNNENNDQEKTITKTFVPYSSVLFSSVLSDGPQNSEIETLKNIVVLDDHQSVVKKDQESENNDDAIAKDEKIFMSPSKKIMKLSRQKPKTKRLQKSTPELIEILSSDDDDSEVIFVENPAPPLIAVESSSDDDGVKEKKRNNKKGSGSPSTSSIISDEFIVRSDKSRLKNIFCKKNLNTASQPISQAHQIYDEDTSNDSIYNTKLMTMNRFQGSLKSISLTNNKIRQRSSSEEEENVGARIIDVNSLKSKEKRLRYEKHNYNETEFTSLISTALVQKTANAEKKEKKSDRRKSTSSKSDIDDVDEEKNAVDKCDLILNVSSDNIRNDSSEEYSFTIDLSGENLTDANQSANNSIDQIDCEVGWNEEMKYFYNEYSYGRDFSLTNVRNLMPFDNWRIINPDRNVVTDVNAKKIRCHNCNEIGHKSFQCYRPKKQAICFMCGEFGHNETRCPKALCLRCGKSTMRFSTVCSNCARFGKKRCPLCKNSFHDLDQCPDKWRRYFATTTEGNDVLDIECKQNDRVYCSVCAKKGHFADSCIYFNKQKDGYITSSWFVISNKPSYTLNSKFEMKVQNNHIFQLLSYMDVYYFNLKLPPNCQFYPNFRKRYLEEKCGIQMIEESKEHQKENIEEVADKIPLESTSKQSTNNDEESSLSEAKILLNINQKNIIKSQKKQIETLGEKFNVALKFPSNSGEFTDQNYLFILGTVLNQNKFHKELREFFFKCELNKHEEKIENSTQLPKTISKITERVKSDLQSIKCIGIREAKKTLQSFIQSEINFDYKSLVKFRRSLNIVFMGYGELKEGAFHLRELKNILVTLEKHIEEGNGNNQLDQKMKDKLAGHLRYIFSPVDHGNYLQLFRNYKQVVMQKKSKKKDVKNN